MSFDYRVRRFSIVKSRVYRDQYIRGYNVNINQDTVDNYIRTVSDLGLNTQSVGRVSNLVGRNSQVYDPINIDGGWESYRNFFTLIIDEIGVLGSESSYILTGYTDGVLTNNHNEALSPQGRLYFNGVLVLKAIETEGGKSYHIASSDEFINWLDATNLDGNVTENGWLNHSVSGRPQDVAITMQQNTIYSDNYSHSGDSIKVLTGSGVVNLSSTKNTLSSSYASSLLRGMRDGDELINMEKDMGGHSDRASWWARVALTSPLIEGSVVNGGDLLRTILSSSMGDRTTGSVTYGALCREFPDINASDVKVIIDNGEISSKVWDVNLWNGRSDETVCAAILSSSIPALANSLGISYISFSVVPNHAFDSSDPYSIIINDDGRGNSLVSFIDSRIPQHDSINRFMAAVSNVVNPDVTNAYTRVVSYSVECDILMDTTINVSVNNNPYKLYISPTVVSGRFSPNILPSADSATAIGSEFEHLHNTSSGMMRRSNMIPNQRAPEPERQAQSSQPNTTPDSIWDYL